MPTTVTDLFTPLTAAQWLQVMLTNAATLSLPTTAWQEGTPELTILTIVAEALANEDRISSQVAQGGFLDSAGSGSVTYTATNGDLITSPVTPEGGPGWLDLLSLNQYDTTRVPAIYAPGNIAIANTTAVASGPYAIGTYHVTNPSTRAAYSNTAPLTIAGVNIVGGTVIGATNASPIVVETSGAHGRTTGDTVKVSGVTGNTAANGFFTITVVDATHFDLDSSTGNGAWVSGGTVNLCTVGAFAADVAGPTGTSARGTITQTVTTLTGVTVYNTGAFYGASVETNADLVIRCRLKLASLSPSGPSGAVEYFAKLAQTLSAPAVIATPATRTKKSSSPSTGTVSLLVASATGAISGIVNATVTGATNASPIVVTTTAAHTLASGNYVTVAGVLGNYAANGTFQIVVTGANTFQLVGTTGTGAYTGGGTVQGGDLGQIYRIVQANAVSDNGVLYVASATAFNIAVAATVTVPIANFAAYQVAAQAKLVEFMAQFPIGGYLTTLPINNIISTLTSAGVVGTSASYVKLISGVTLNGVAASVTYPSSSHVGVLSPTPVITVIGV